VPYGAAALVLLAVLGVRIAYAAALVGTLSRAHAGAGGQPLCKTCNCTFATVAEYREHCGLHRLQNLVKSVTLFANLA
jgi:hypothetical protein